MIPKLPKKKYALLPSERHKICSHPAGFAWDGKMPCTGVRRCHLCKTSEEKAKCPLFG